MPPASPEQGGTELLVLAALGRYLVTQPYNHGCYCHRSSEHPARGSAARSLPEWKAKVREGIERE